MNTLISLYTIILYMLLSYNNNLTKIVKLFSIKTSENNRFIISALLFGLIYFIGLQIIMSLDSIDGFIVSAQNIEPITNVQPINIEPITNIGSIPNVQPITNIGSIPNVQQNLIIPKKKSIRRRFMNKLGSLRTNPQLIRQKIRNRKYGIKRNIM